METYIEYMENYNINNNLYDIYGNTLLMYVCEYYNPIETVKLILEKTPNCKIRILV